MNMESAREPSRALKNVKSLENIRFSRLLKVAEGDGFGSLTFDIDKHRFSFYIPEPYNEERKNQEVVNSHISLDMLIPHICWSNMVNSVPHHKSPLM